MEYLFKGESIKLDDSRIQEALKWSVVGTNRDFGLQIISNGIEFVVLDGWNGEGWFECFCSDKFGYCLNKMESNISVYPIYEINENFEIVGYKVED